MKKLLEVIIITFALAAFVSSCTPKSAMLTRAVILDDYDDIEVVGDEYMYKIYVPTYGITHSYGDWKLHEKGDTLLIHDQWRNYSIK